MSHSLPLAPRANRDPLRLNALREMMNQPHIAPLTRYVERLRSARPGWQFPDFDPTGGGIDGDILLLAEKPGPKSVLSSGGSGFTSICNDDPTAEASFAFCEQAGIVNDRTVRWNVMPGWNGTREFTPEERKWGKAQLADLLCLLPGLRVVVLIGGEAQKAGPLIAAYGLPVIVSAHPSRMVRNRPLNRHLWDAIPAQWLIARKIADGLQDASVAVINAPARSSSGPTAVQWPRPVEIRSAGENQSGQRRGRSNNANGVALSWQNDEIRAKRSRRWEAHVAGQVYPSVKQACLALAFRPRGGHIKWRGRLVDAAGGKEGITDETGRHWQVFERTGVANWEAGDHGNGGR